MLLALETIKHYKDYYDKIFKNVEELSKRHHVIVESTKMPSNYIFDDQ